MRPRLGWRVRDGVRWQKCNAAQVSRPPHQTTARPRAECRTDAMTSKCPSTRPVQLRRQLIPPRDCLWPTPHADTTTRTWSLGGPRAPPLLCIRLQRRNLKITTSNGPQPEHDSRITDAPVMHQGLLNCGTCSVAAAFSSPAFYRCFTCRPFWDGSELPGSVARCGSARAW